MKRIPIVATLIALSCTVSRAFAADPPPADARQAAEGVELLTYRGWKDCYRLHNADCEATIVPAVRARLSSFSFRGKNVLLADSAVDGRVMYPLDRGNDYHYWIPWDGCQPDMIDQKGTRQFHPVWMGPYRASKVEPFGITTESIKQAKVQQGDARCVKRFALDPKEPKLAFDYQMVNEGSSPKNWAIFQRMVLAPPGFLLIPLKKGSTMEGGFKMTESSGGQVFTTAVGQRTLARIKQHIVVAAGDSLVIAPQMFGAKSRVFMVDRLTVQTDSDAGWMAWIVGDAALVISYPRPTGAPQMTPNVVTQAAFGEDRVELNCYGPKTDVPAQGSLQFNTVWRFVPLEKPVTDAQHAAQLRETLAKAAGK